MRIAFVALMISAAVATADNRLQLGSKKFTESYVLAEIAKRALAENGVTSDHRQGMGGTIILWEALRTGQIAAYPEYTGTIAEEILKAPESMSAETMRAELAKAGVEMTGELGFNNTYALVMPRASAERRRSAKSATCAHMPICSSVSRMSSSVAATAGDHSPSATDSRRAKSAGSITASATKRFAPAR
jgi:osmoprotectant transport system permease protein